MMTPMRALRQFLSVLLIALVASSTVALPSSAIAAIGHGTQAAASDCHCPKSDCAKNANCANVVCASACANLIAANLPVAEWMPIFDKVDRTDLAENDRPTVDGPPPLPPPRA